LQRLLHWDHVGGCKKASEHGICASSPAVVAAAIVHEQLMQAGFLNRPSPPLARRQRENAQQPTQNVVKLDQAFSWGPSKDVLREHNSNDDAGAVSFLRNDAGKPTARFDVGDICEVVGGALVRASEELDSDKIGQLVDGCRAEVVEVGSGPTGKRIAIEDTDGLRGWVSVVATTGETLVRIVEKELRGEARAKRIEAAAKAARHDCSKPTARFDVGDVCDVVGGAIMRESEDLDSRQLGKLQNKSQVKVVEIGTGPTGKRLLVTDDTGRAGWISVVSSDGTQLLRPVKTPELPLPETPQEMQLSKQVTHVVAPQVRKEVLSQALAPFVEPAVLVSSSRAQRGFDLEISYLEREHMEQLLADKFATEGVQEPSYDHVKLRDAKGKWYRPGEAPEVPTPDLFPITLYYRPPKPEQSAEMVLALRQRQAYEALTPTQRRGLSEVQRQLERAYSSESNDLLDRAMRLAHSLGLPLGTAGLPVSLMPESVCFPKGNEPLLYDGHLYSMQSTSMLVFDPPDFSVPMGIWNAQRQRVDPAVMQNDDAGRTDIIHFGKTFHMLEQGHVIDPDSQQVVGMIRPMTGDFEFFDPIPLPVADFMMRRGFRLEAPSARLTNGPFVQILPQVEDDDGIPELHLQMQAAGNAKALKYAPIEQRGNKDVMIQAMRQGQGPQSWKIMLCGTQEILEDRDVLSEAVKQDYSAMAYASNYYSDRNFMLQAVQQHGVALQYGTEEIRADPDLAYMAVKASWRALENVSEKLRGSSRIVREAVKQCWQALEYASEELQDDKDVVNLAVKQTWRALQFASGRLRGDAAFMLKAVAQSVDALHFANDLLLGDADFMKQAVQLDGMALRFAAEDVVDRDLVLEAVRTNWHALQHAPDGLRADRAVVLEAVRQHHSALKLASPDALLDEELIFEAARRRPDLLRSLPDEPRSSRGLMMRMVKLHPMSLQYAADGIRCDEEIVLEALRRNWRSFQFAAPELKSSQRFLLQAVQLDALVLSLADEELRKDPQIVCEAVEREWEMLQHVSEELRGNRTFMMEAVGIEGMSLKYASAELSHDRELVVAAIGNSGQALEFAAQELRSDPEMVLMAIRQDFEAVCHAHEALAGDFSFMFRAVRVDGRALKGATIELQADPDLVLAAVQQNWRSLGYANRALRANLDFMLQAVGVDGFALAMAAEELWMHPQLLAAAAQDRDCPQDSASLEEHEPEVGTDLRQLLRQARPNWSEADLQSAEQKLSVIGVTTVPLLAQASASDLNGRLRAAGQKIFTATTVMECGSQTLHSSAFSPSFAANPLANSELFAGLFRS
ncbi:unnamed protein product, partial [Symbiodinium sp. KB8]